MTAFYSRNIEHSKKFSNHSARLMPIFYGTTRNRVYTKTNLAQHNDENNAYKEDSISQITRTWKLKTIDHQYLSKSERSHPFIDQISLTESTTINSIPNLSNESLSNNIDKNGNKDELPVRVDESDKSIIAMKKRSAPISSSYMRRRPRLKDNTSPKESFDTQSLATDNKTKFTETKTSIKTVEKSVPIFIPPKKPSSRSHAFSTYPFNDPFETKQKPIFKLQSTFADKNNSSSTTNWVPTSPLSQASSHMQTVSSSHDESSNNDSDQRNLLVTNSKTKLNDEQRSSSCEIYFNIPSVILITDPDGYSHVFNPDADSKESKGIHEEILNDGPYPTNTNTLYPNSVIDLSVPTDIMNTSSVSSTKLGKHTLDSIGEEDEEDIEEPTKNLGHIVSRELERMETLNRLCQTSSYIIRKADIEFHYDTNKEAINRRWSDGVFNQNKTSTSSSKIKRTSWTSVKQQSDDVPVKLSITKYLRMKLHFTSSNKDNKSNISSSEVDPQRKSITHHRTDQKRSQPE